MSNLFKIVMISHYMRPEISTIDLQVGHIMVAGAPDSLVKMGRYEVREVRETGEWT